MWPRGRVSLGPVPSPTVCWVAAGLGLTPLSIDFTLCLETLSIKSPRRRAGRGASEALLGTSAPRPRVLLGRGFPKGIALSPAPETAMTLTLVSSQTKARPKGNSPHFVLIEQTTISHF